jgi:hypothetical protein
VTDRALVASDVRARLLEAFDVLALGVCRSRGVALERVTLQVRAHPRQGEAPGSGARVAIVVDEAPGDPFAEVAAAGLVRDLPAGQAAEGAVRDALALALAALGPEAAEDAALLCARGATLGLVVRPAAGEVVAVLVPAGGQARPLVLGALRDAARAA